MSKLELQLYDKTQRPSMCIASSSYSHNHYILLTIISIKAGRQRVSVKHTVSDDTGYPYPLHHHTPHPPPHSYLPF